MTTEADRLWPALFHGWIELLTLLLILFVTLHLWHWAHGRRLRPAERGGTSAWPLVLIAFALVLVIRALNAGWPQAALIAGSVMIAGWLSRSAKYGVPWIPAFLFAALVGLGWMLSALVLAVAGFVILLLSARRS